MKFTLNPLTAILITSFVLSSIGCSEQPKNQNEKIINSVLVAKDQQEVKSYAKFVADREDDFTWENDLVAFRMYGPSSLATPTNAASGVDLWLKRVNYSIIDQWYDNHFSGNNYHKDWGEGYDPYHTGISRGTGGTAIWIDGAAYPAGTYTAWRIIDDNPEKVVFELDYTWQTKLGNVSETKKISLALGSQLFEVTSRFLLNGQPAKNLSIAIGIATHDEAAKSSFNKNQGWIAAWEKIKGDDLGTGVVVSPDTVDEIIHLPSKTKDESHIWLITHTNEQGNLHYAAGYGWELANIITTEAQWHQYLNNYSLSE